MSTTPYGSDNYIRQCVHKVDQQGGFVLAIGELNDLVDQNEGCQLLALSIEMSDHLLKCACDSLLNMGQSLPSFIRTVSFSVRFF